MSKLPDEAFRDTIGTIDTEGNRKFIFPKKPSGKFYDYWSRFRHPFYGNFWTNILRMDLSADYFFRNGFPQNRILDRR